MQIIKHFVEQFRNCPKCGYQLKITAKEKTDIESSHKHRFNIFTRYDRLIINIESDYFISVDQNSFEFSISIMDGQILHSDYTSKFISLYDLDIILEKNCLNCAREYPPEIFHQSINIYYDRVSSVFTADPWIEQFSFSFNDNYYYFSNNFKEQRSLLSVQGINSTIRKPILETPYISFDKFSFGDKEKLLSKINSIRLLL